MSKYLLTLTGRLGLPVASLHPFHGLIALLENPMNPLSSLAETLPMPEGQRASLTLLDLKDDTKVVLVAVPGGVQIPAHQVPYPASVLLLSGSIEVMLGEQWTRLAPGSTVPIVAGVLHAIRAGEPSYLIVTHLRALGTRAPAST